MRTLRQILLRVVTTRVAWPILISIGLLSVVSLGALELASPERAAKQQIWLIAGAGVILIALLPHYNLLGRIAYALYGLTVVLLVAVFFAPSVANTHRWFVLPGGTQLQPSELAKISFVLALAWHLRFRKNLHHLTGLAAAFCLAGIPFALILVEPDLGTAMLFPLVLYAMLLAAGARMRHLLGIAFVALFLMIGSYPFLKPYQQQRIRSFALMVMGWDDATHRSGPGYQQFQSLVSIGSGGMTGQGTEGAKPFRQGLLPEAYTDFIFSVTGAEWGFAGCILLLILYLGFFAAAMEIASSTRDFFGRMLVVGLASTILFQATINMYMTAAMAPVVGISLPFVSYGGSSLLASMLAAGLILNVSVRRQFKSPATV